MPAELAGITSPGSDFVMRRNLSARFAVNSIGIKIILKPFEAYIIIRKLFTKILNSVFNHFRLNWLISHIFISDLKIV